MIALLALNLGLLSAGAGYKCHLGGHPHGCCENEGKGPNCNWSGSNGCNPNSLNLGKACDESLGGPHVCTSYPTITKNPGGMSGYAGSAEFTLNKNSGTF